MLGRDLVADQAMQGMADVVRFVPGISMGQGEGHRDAPTIRGQSTTADFFVDGVRDDAQYLRDDYNQERVEAIKAPNPMVFGRGGGGGVINRVTRAAQWTPTRAVSAEGGSWDHLRATLDVGGAVTQALAGRLNALSENSGSFRHHARLERLGVNPSAAIRLGGTMVRSGYERFEDRRTVDRGIPSFRDGPVDLDAATYVGDPDASRGSLVMHAGHASIERGEAGKVQVRNRTRVASYDKAYQNVFPSGSVNAAGTRVNLAAYSHAIDRHNAFNQTDVTWSFGGPVAHTLLVGGEVGRQHTDQVRRTGYFDDSLTSYSVPVTAPTVRAPVTWRQSATDADSRATAEIGAVYVQDQIAIGRFVRAIVGLRQERFALAYRNDRSGARLRRTDRMLSPRAGLVIKPVESVSLYGNWAVSHLPASGDQFTVLTPTTVTLEPERFASREAGVRWEAQSDLALTGAVYSLTRTNTTAPDPRDASRVVQTGALRASGWELGATGALTSRWQVSGGWTRQEATFTSRTSSARLGATAPLVPGSTLAIWNRVELLRAVSAGIGVVRQSSMFAAVDNAVSLPAFTRVDGAAYLPLASGVRAQVNVENMLGARYYATSHGNNNIMPGAPRTLRVSATVTP